MLNSVKYIFLDFDGPLNTGRSDYMDPYRYGHHFDDVAVRNLRRIIDKTGAKIVVSSSWRHMGIERIKEIWKKWRGNHQLYKFTNNSLKGVIAAHKYAGRAKCRSQPLQ